MATHTDTHVASTAAEEQQITIRYRNEHLSVPVAPASTLNHLKRKIQELTGVHVDHQKLLGLSLGDDAPLPRITKKLMLINAAPRAPVVSSGAQDSDNDNDADNDADDAADAPITNDPDELQATLQRRIASTQVLDIDYTLFDLSSSAERAEELARPHLHEFLTAAYNANFDLLIWSATSLKWVELKMRELGCLSHAEYRIVCMLDAKSMLTVHSPRYGVYNCKPLAFVWGKFENVYSPANTVMVDDLRRNYVLNPQNGLVIKPYKRRAHKQDTELRKIKVWCTAVDCMPCVLFVQPKPNPQAYLEAIAGLDSFANLDHDQWATYRKRGQ